MALLRLFAIAVVALLGCDASRVSEPAPPPSEPARRERMEGRFEATHGVRAALERGDVEAARVGALAIAVDAHVAGRADDAPSRARDVALAPDVRAAAAAFGDMLVACGGCHERAGVTMPDLDPSPPETGDLAERMQLHAWASREMCDAIAMGSARRFERAAAALDIAPFSGETPPDEERPEGLRAIEERLRAAARSGPRTPAERAHVYGVVLGTCADCHSRIRALDQAPP
jgi:hypothetical protein